MPDWLRPIITLLLIIPVAATGMYIAYRAWKRTTWDAVKTDESEARVQKRRRP
jgi:hypothetical protein